MKNFTHPSSVLLRKKINAFAAVFKKIPWLLAQHAFLTILACLALELLVGELLFYKYAVLVNNKEPLAIQPPVVFKESAYQLVIKELQDRQDAYLSAGRENVVNPFKPD